MSKDKDNKSIYTIFCGQLGCKAKTTPSAALFGWGYIKGKHYCPQHQMQFNPKPKKDDKKKP